MANLVKMLSTHKNLKFTNNYVNNLIRYGLHLGEDYNYELNVMTNMQLNEYEDEDVDVIDSDDLDTTVCVNDYLKLLLEKLQNVNSVVIPNIKGLIIKNTDGFNNDPRCTIEDEFSTSVMKRMYTDTYKLYKDTEVTLSDLINGVWNVKSSKTDTNYEMYTGCSMKILKNCGKKTRKDDPNEWFDDEELDDNSNEKGDMLYIELTFDHGS